MNIIKSFNDTIDYLETVLDDEIDKKEVLMCPDIRIQCSVACFLF